jgi:hypothetical protein
MLCRAERDFRVQLPVFQVQNLNEVLRLCRDQVTCRRCSILAGKNRCLWSNRKERTPLVAEFNVNELEASVRFNGESDRRNLTRLLDILNIEDAFVDMLPRLIPVGV